MYRIESPMMNLHSKPIVLAQPATYTPKKNRSQEATLNAFLTHSSTHARPKRESNTSSFNFLPCFAFEACWVLWRRAITTRRKQRKVSRSYAAKGRFGSYVLAAHKFYNNFPDSNKRKGPQDAIHLEVIFFQKWAKKWKCEQGEVERTNKTISTVPNDEMIMIIDV